MYTLFSQQFDANVTLKYDQGHYQRLNLNEYYHHAKPNINYFGVQENDNVEDFTRPSRSAGLTQTLQLKTNFFL